MKITNIAQQVKRAGRYSIFVDSKYAFSLSEGALIESKLAVGQELSSGEVGQFKKLSTEDKLYNNALHYTALRARSRWEIETYLTRKGSPAPLTKTILNKLSKIGLINDNTFAQTWIENRRLLKPTSRRRLIQELRAKHVAQEVIDRALAEDTTEEEQVLKELIERKRKQSKYQDKLKLMQYLARQGFNYDDIKSALNET